MFIIGFFIALHILSSLVQNAEEVPSHHVLSESDRIPLKRWKVGFLTELRIFPVLL